MSEENTGLSSPYSLADKLITRGPISKDKPYRIDENGCEVPNRIFDNPNAKEEPKKEELDMTQVNELYDALHNILDQSMDSKYTATLMPKEFLTQMQIPEEMEKLAFPDTSTTSNTEETESVEDGAKLIQTSKWGSQRLYTEEEQPSITCSSLYPDKSYGTGTVESVASLAHQTKEELKEAIQEKNQKQQDSVNDPGLLYQKMPVYTYRIPRPIRIKQEIRLLIIP